MTSGTISSGVAYPTVLAFNPGHDGAVAALRNGTLAFSIEAEKNSFPRYMHAGPELFLEALIRVGERPDVIAVSGWDFDEIRGDNEYFGTSERLTSLRQAGLFGTCCKIYRSTHERSHIFCSYGLSPFEQGKPCYALTWEGEIGTFYEIDESLRIKRLDQVLSAPGYKYAFMFDLADPTRVSGGWRHDAAGKLMALSAYSTHGQQTAEEKSIIRKVLNEIKPPVTPKQPFQESCYLNCGVTDPAFTEMAGKFSDEIFDLFYQYAKRNLTKGHPLLISGGCGLNCEWNSRWRNSEIFEDVFVPPVVNDSGSALGTAIEAQFHVSGHAKIEWDAYRGLDFDMDGRPDDFKKFVLDFDRLANLLKSEEIVAWVQGRYEIGPRALGNRSLLASPFREEMKARLNEIKGRESYRPIAPVCLADDAREHFGADHRPSPYMLYFYKTRTPDLRAVTHVDGSARIQTVALNENPPLHKLLTAFKEHTGFGVLCNTSLNYSGRGFINRSSDLFNYARLRDIGVVVINNELYLNTRLCTSKREGFVGAA
jgi:hydroxymethyl cephem carbamoyltransferase